MYNNLFDSQEHGFAVYSSNSPQLSAQPQITVADPDLQIRWGPVIQTKRSKVREILKTFFGPLDLSLVQK